MRATSLDRNGATSRLRRVVAQRSHPNEIDRFVRFLISSSHGSALRVGSRLGSTWGCNMSCHYSKNWYVASKACSVSTARARTIVQLIVVAASLAACAESTVVRNSKFASPNQQASSPRDQTASSVTNRRVASVRKHTPFARHQASWKRLSGAPAPLNAACRTALPPERSGPRAAAAPRRWCRRRGSSGCAWRRHAARSAIWRWRARDPSPDASW